MEKALLVPHPSEAHTCEFFETLVLLRMTTTEGPVYFVVGGLGIWDDTETSEEKQQGDAYFYEESQCPTNFIPVEGIFVPGNADPHGLFEHVRTIWKPAAYVGKFGGNDWMLPELFPEMGVPAQSPPIAVRA